MAASMRQSPEHLRLAIDDRATVADVGPTLRVAIGYRGPVAVDGGRPRAVDGEIRQYFHARGVDVLHATCLTTPGPCADRASLLAQAERALLDHLGDAGPVGILPDGGRCEASRENVVGAAAHTMTCVYGRQLELGLRRMTDKDTRRVVSALAEHPAFRDSLELQPRAHPQHRFSTSVSRHCPLVSCATGARPAGRRSTASWRASRKRTARAWLVDARSSTRIDLLEDLGAATPGRVGGRDRLHRGRRLRRRPRRR